MFKSESYGLTVLGKAERIPNRHSVVEDSKTVAADSPFAKIAMAPPHILPVECHQAGVTTTATVASRRPSILVAARPALVATSCSNQFQT